MIVGEHVPLAPLTTLGVGGPARFLVQAQAQAEVREAVQFARERGLSLFVLGGGSNLLVADAGFNGVVLKIALIGTERVDEGSRAIFTVAAGEDWDAFVARTRETNCGGIECLSGIPGSVGGTPVQNVGAYGQEVSETIRAVEVFDRRAIERKILDNKECGFAYRSSMFNTVERDHYVILRVSFALRRGGTAAVHYTDLQKVLAN